MNTEVKNVIIATDGKAQYDTSAKRLLAQKNILAHITLTILAVIWVMPLIWIILKLQGTEGSVYKLIFP